jgi:hypothetical protein
MAASVPAKLDIDRQLVKLIAMDIGKAVVSHIRTMHPNAAKALGKSGQLSVRNATYNEIIAALETTDAEEIIARLERRKKWRREHHAAWSKIRGEAV